MKMFSMWRGACTFHLLCPSWAASSCMLCLNRRQDQELIHYTGSCWEMRLERSYGITNVSSRHLPQRTGSKTCCQLHHSPNYARCCKRKTKRGERAWNYTAHIHQMAKMAHLNPAVPQVPNKPVGLTVSTDQYTRFPTGEHRFVQESN